MTLRRLKTPKIRVAWWLGWVQWVLVRYVRVERAWIDAVRRSAARGSVVFVLRNRSLIDFLCLRGICRKHGLPEVSFVSGLSSFFYLPFLFWVVDRFRLHRPEVLRQRMVATLGASQSAVVFLRRPAVGGTLGSRPVAVDGIRLAVEVQGELGVRMQALPTVFLWGESSLKRLPGSMDFLFGSNEYPRLLRSIWLLLRRRSVHELIAGDPLDVAALRKERDIDTRKLAGVVRAGVGRQIELMRRSRLGSLTKPSSRIMSEVLKSARLRNQLAAVTEGERVSEREVARRTRQILKKLAADFRPRVVSLFAFVMQFVWKRIYTGVDLTREDLERLRVAIGEGATLLLPAHKSHIDYIVLSHVMKENNLMMPHVAAGQNLSFWPLGWLFRSSGAFFIRRRFVNDRFYTAVVSAYVRRLIQEGYAVEVFIEGGRSRTGKLLRPKTGMLDMALKAIAVTPRANLTVVPIFIGYEHVIEERAYVAESKGEPKRAESIRGLLGTVRVLFGRYGRVYLRVGRSFTVDRMLSEKGMNREDLLSDSVRRTFAFEVGTRNLEEINRMTIATPSSILSTVLLSSTGDSISGAELRSRVRWLADFLGRNGVALSARVIRWRREHASNDVLLERSISVFVRVGRIVRSRGEVDDLYTIREDQRLALDYYKNNILHFLVPASLVANICIAAGQDTVALRQVQEQMGIACSLYESEFILGWCFRRNLASGGGSRSTILTERGVAQLVATGVLVRRADQLSIRDRGRAAFLSEVMRNYHEVYLSAVEAARERGLSKCDETASNLAVDVMQRHLREKRFIKPEGHSVLNRKSAMNTLKELKLLRPPKGEAPFDPGNRGDVIYRYLLTAVGAGMGTGSDFPTGEA